jgi:hypothetical protein
LLSEEDEDDVDDDEEEVSAFAGTELLPLERLSVR